MAGKIAFKLPKRRSRMGKTQPSVADVHAPASLGSGGKRKAKDFLTVIGEIAGGAKIVQLPILPATADSATLDVGKGAGIFRDMGVGTVVHLVDEDGARVKTILFMRHGPTRFNNQTDMSKDRVRSWNNVPLTKEGVEDAQKAAEKLKDEGIGYIVSSDLGRAVQTSKIVGKEAGVRPVHDYGMRPWNLGKFTGMPSDEAHDGIIHHVENPDTVVDGGESFNEFKSRAVQSMLSHIKKAGRKKMLAVSHHRNERLFASMRPDGTNDPKKFMKTGEDPGDFTEMELNLATLRKALKQAEGADGDVGKVWDSNAALPDSVKNSLPDEAQTVFRRVANDRMKAGHSEVSSIKQAWTAVKNGWHKTEGGEWVRKFALDAESLIVFTDQQIELAKQLPSDAVQGPQDRGPGAPDPNNASLQLQPLDADNSWAKTPFPWDQNALAKLRPEQVKPFLGALTNQDALPVKLVYLRNVVALQDRVNPDKVQSMVDDEPADLPLVVLVNGRKVIADGHHRMTARYLMGRKTAQVRFMNLDDPDAQGREDDSEVGAAKKRWRSFLEVICKFNPFHDELGRFTSSPGTGTFHDEGGRFITRPTATGSMVTFVPRGGGRKRLRFAGRRFAKFDPNEPRDERGRWTEDGGFQSTLKEPLSADEKRAVQKYAGENYVEMNGALRGDMKASAQVKEWNKTLSAAIKKSKTDAPAKVFRGINLDTSKYEEGTTIKVKGFISTSTSEDVAKGDAAKRYLGWSKGGGTMMEIRIGSGSHALDLSASGADVAAENEILLPHNSTFRIVNVDGENRRVVMEMA